MDQYELTDALNQFADKLFTKFVTDVIGLNNLQNSEIIKDIIAINCCKQIPKNNDESDIDYMMRIWDTYKIGRNLMK